MKVRTFAVVLVASLSCSVFGQAGAGRPDTPPQRPVAVSMPAAPDIEQFMKIRAPNSPTLAPDGTLFVRDWPDGVNQLYMRRPGDDPAAPMKRLTDFPDGLSSYSLSHDGKHIILSAAMGGNEQTSLYHLDPSSGAISELLTNPKVVHTFNLWLRDDSGFIYVANDASPADFHIYRFDLATRTSTKLLAQPGSWSAADITDDGARLLVNRYTSQSHTNAFELDAATGELSALDVGPEPSFNLVSAYLPGEKSVAIVSDKEEGIARLFVRELGSGSITKPVPAMDRFDVESGAMNEDRSIAAVTYNEDGYASMRLFSLPDFKEVPLPGIEKGIVGDVDIRQQQLTWTLSNTRQPGLAYTWLINSRAMPRQLTQAQTQGVDLSRFALPEVIRYSSFDGLEVPAFLYVPPGYVKGRPVPFVVSFHGGPEGQSRPGFSPLTQFLLASGFGVIQPNVRGSTGYGRAFHMMDDYKKRWDSVKDGVEAARWLVKNGYSENGRIAAYGGSYGGFMSVATIIEGPEVFGASIDVVGIVNMKTFLEQTKDYRRKLREVEYGPLDDPEFLASISPINRIDEIRVPMLIAHGLNDPRVPVGEAMQLAVGLQKRGYDPELLFFPDEGHGFAKLENRLLFAKKMVRFLDAHIRN